MTKDELTGRLKALGVQLGREISLTGSKEELALRVAELEEELDDDADSEAEGGNENSLPAHEVPIPPVQRISVKTRVRVHIDSPLDLAGAVTDVTPDLAKQLTELGLAREN